MNVQNCKYMSFHLCNEIQKVHLHKLHIYYLSFINIFQQNVHFGLYCFFNANSQSTIVFIRRFTDIIFTVCICSLTAEQMHLYLNTHY